jgi:hypothetical protein
LPPQDDRGLSLFAVADPLLEKCTHDLSFAKMTVVTINMPITPNFE